MSVTVTLIIPALWRLRLEDSEFEANLGYVMHAFQASCGCIVISTVCYGCNNHGSNLSPNTSDRTNAVRGEVGVLLAGGAKVCLGVWT